MAGHAGTFLLLHFPGIVLGGGKSGNPGNPGSKKVQEQISETI